MEGKEGVERAMRVWRSGQTDNGMGKRGKVAEDEEEQQHGRYWYWYTAKPQSDRARHRDEIDLFFRHIYPMLMGLILTREMNSSKISHGGSSVIGILSSLTWAEYSSPCNFC
jgi:hypothetical protein